MKTRCILIASISLLGLLFALPSNAKPDFPKTAEDDLIVGCLLPGQVRKLGRMNSFLSQRRPAGLSQFECALRGGEYVEYDRANLQTALSVWLAAASGGDVAAMVMVGEAFAKGAGQAPDYAQAVFWFQRASNAGNKRAYQNLRHLYELDLGVAADRHKALNFYRMASAVAGERVVFTSTLATETIFQALLNDVSKDLDAERAKRASFESEVSTLKARLNAAQATMPARSVPVLANCCYVGTLTAPAVPRASASFGSGDWAAWVKASGSGRSRMALTSGGVSPVFDAKAGGSSLFSAAILKALRRNHRVLDAQMLYQESSDLLALTSASEQLTDLPTFAPIAFAGHERGELLLAGK